jgi:hypothetical protein
MPFSKKAYNAGEPIETLYAQIEEATTIADAGIQPYRHQQILNNAFLLVRNSGVFRDACRKWKRIPPLNQNWAAFKHHFAIAAQENREDQTSGQEGGYHSANSAMEEFQTETTEAFANLASATAANRQMLQELIATNTQLFTQLAVKDSEIARLRNTAAPAPAHAPAPAVAPVTTTGRPAPRQPRKSVLTIITIAGRAGIMFL